jgi:hypothetical protein
MTGPAWVRISPGMNLGTWLFTKLKGRRVGVDAIGNVYYVERRARGGGICRAAGMARLAALHHG